MLDSWSSQSLGTEAVNFLLRGFNLFRESGNELSHDKRPNQQLSAGCSFQLVSSCHQQTTCIDDCLEDLH